jgi:hypothetical protein
MLNVLTTRIGLTLRRIAGHLGDVVRAALGPGHPDHLQALWRRRRVLEPVRVRVRRDADRF